MAADLHSGGKNAWRTSVSSGARRVFGCYFTRESGVPLARDESRILLAALDTQSPRALREREQCEVVVQGRQTTWSGSREGLGMNA